MVLNRSSIHEKQERSQIQILYHILQVLKKFKGNYEKQLNFSKFGQYLGIKQFELDEIIQLIFEFQDLYVNTFKTYYLKKKIIDSQLYLTSEKVHQLSNIPRKIKMSQSHLNMFNDIFYFFKHVKRGRGFDICKNGKDLLKNVKELCDHYPYLFQEQKNGLIYPSEFGLKFGEIILSYKKTNKIIDKIEIDESELKVNINE
jgi:hypothetical protein